MATIAATTETPTAGTAPEPRAKIQAPEMFRTSNDNDDMSEIEALLLRKNENGVEYDEKLDNAVAEVDEPAAKKVKPSKTAKVDAEVDDGEENPDADAEENPEAVDEENPEAVDMATYELDGVEYEVPQTLLDGVTNSKQHKAATAELATHSDYVANTTRQLMEEVQTHKELAPLQLQVDNFAGQYNALRDSLPNVRNDPAASMEIRDLMDEVTKQSDAAQAELNRRRPELAAKQEQTQKDIRAASDRVLAKLLPDATNKTYTEVRDYALKMGYSAGELQQLTHPLTIKALHDAMAYAKIKAGVGSAKRRTKKAAPYISPSAKRAVGNKNAARKTTQDTLFARAKKSGSVEDGIDAITNALRDGAQRN